MSCSKASRRIKVSSIKVLAKALGRGNLLVRRLPRRFLQGCGRGQGLVSLMDVDQNHQKIESIRSKREVITLTYVLKKFYSFENYFQPRQFKRMYTSSAH